MDINTIRSVMEEFAPPIFAGGAAIIPTFWGQIKASEKQLGIKPERLTVIKGLSRGVKAAPVVGVIVGTQMVAHKFFSKYLFGGKKDFWTNFAASALVGGISAPLLAIFNGYTMGQDIQTTLRKFSGKQIVALATQESSFVASLGASGIVSEAIGRGTIAEIAGAFTSGGIGSVIGHPANTVCTLLQKDKDIVQDPFLRRTFYRRVVATTEVLFKGVAYRGLAVAAFNALYQQTQKVMQEVFSEEEV